MTDDNVVTWRAQAACAGTPASVFFVEQGADVAAARQICAGCPVQAECLADALDRHEPYGVWGGTTPRERRSLLAPVPQRACKQCGRRLARPISGFRLFCGDECLLADRAARARRERALRSDVAPPARIAR